VRRLRSPAALLDLPRGSARSELRAGLRAMRVAPGNMPIDRLERDRILRKLGNRPETVAFVDVSRAGIGKTTTVLELDAVLPRDATRHRVFLTRLAGGHVSDADRRWVRSLGFADLLPHTDGRDCEEGLRTALDTVARVLALPPLAPAALRNEACVGERLDAAMRRFLPDRTRNRFDAGSRALAISQIFDWYRKDFGQGHVGYDSL
jgi:hypothetical protein